MTRRANQNDRLLAKALKNGAEILGEVPKRLQPKVPKARREGEYTNRLGAAAALGWWGIETYDGLLYRFHAGAVVSAWGLYEDVTKIETGPAGRG